MIPDVANGIPPKGFNNLLIEEIRPCVGRLIVVVMVALKTLISWPMLARCDIESF
jgi:hypothetical protein